MPVQPRCNGQARPCVDVHTRVFDCAAATQPGATQASCRACRVRAQRSPCNVRSRTDYRAREADHPLLYRRQTPDPRSGSSGRGRQVGRESHQDRCRQVISSNRQQTATTPAWACGRSRRPCVAPDAAHGPPVVTSAEAVSTAFAQRMPEAWRAVCGIYSPQGWNCGPTAFRKAGIRGAT